MQNVNKKEIPVFFATDDNYVSFLCVSIQSMLDNANKDYFYKIHILQSQLSEASMEKISKYNTESSSVEFVDVSKKLDAIGCKLNLRDYYTKATYYRFFIPALFPQYDKALYLDCDIVILDDISKIFNVDLGDKLVGAVQEEVMAQIQVFGDYVEEVLDIKCENYFNAGILLMNLKMFRDEDIECKFVSLISQFKFKVTQDQDYLNVLCKDRVHYFDLGWNKTPMQNEKFKDGVLKIVHYKMSYKPWHYDNVLYGEYFWEYAKKTSVFLEIINHKINYTDAQKQNDEISYNKLVNLAIESMNDENNYRKVMQRNSENKEEVVWLKMKNLKIV